jgi:hypothetical protein
MNELSSIQLSLDKGLNELSGRIEKLPDGIYPQDGYFSHP